MVVLPFMGGLVLAYDVDFPLVFVFLLALIIFIFIFLLRLKPDLTQWLLILLFILIGIARLEFKTLPAAQNHIAKFADLPYPVTIEGILTKPVERSGTNLSAVLRADSIWVLHRAWATNGKCLLKIYQPCDSLTYGSRIVARGQLRLPEGERNPGAFNYKKYLAAQDIHAVFRVTSAQHVVRLNENEGRPILRKMVYPVRHAILQVIDDSLDGQPAALLKALLVGVRGELDGRVGPEHAVLGYTPVWREPRNPVITICKPPGKNPP